MTPPVPVSRGARVRITGHPARHPELTDLVGSTGEVAKTRKRPEDRGKTLLITGLPFGDVWLAEGYCEGVAEDKEAGAA